MKENCFSALALFFLSAGLFAEPELKMELNHPDGLFKSGETVRYTISLKDGDQFVPGKKILWELNENGFRQKRITVETADGPVIVEASLSSPGWSHCAAWMLDENGATAKNSKKERIFMDRGAVFDSEKLLPAPEPEDFDAFWKACREELAKVPMKAELRDSEVWERDKGRVKCFDVKIDCAGDRPVSGFLTMPVHAEPKSLPIYLTLHGAGVRSANKPFGAGRVALALDINAHGIENGKSEEYYTTLAKGELRDYPAFGLGDRNASYWKNMYLRALRALEYLKSRPEWDGETVIVEGSSQGGAQALAVAGLDPDVTLCVASYPALCDQGGELAAPPHKPGWPALTPPRNGEPSAKKIADCMAYFDSVNFAKRIRADLYLSIGFTDTTTPPNGIFAAYNNALNAKSRHAATHPNLGHGARNEPGWAARDHELTKHLYNK